MNMVFHVSIEEDMLVEVFYLSFSFVMVIMRLFATFANFVYLGAMF
jgi:hypothetical protein